MKLEFYPPQNDSAQVALALIVDGIRFRSYHYANLAESNAPFLRLDDGGALVSVTERSSQRTRWVLVTPDGARIRQYDSLAKALFWQEKRAHVPRIQATLPSGWRITRDKEQLCCEGNYIRPVTPIIFNKMIFSTRVGGFLSLQEAFDALDLAITDKGFYKGYQFHTERRGTNRWRGVIVLPKALAHLFTGPATDALLVTLDTGEVYVLLNDKDSRTSARQNIVWTIEHYLPEPIGY